MSAPQSGGRGRGNGRGRGRGRGRGGGRGRGDGGGSGSGGRGRSTAVAVPEEHREDPPLTGSGGSHNHQASSAARGTSGEVVVRGGGRTVTGRSGQRNRSGRGRESRGAQSRDAQSTGGRTRGGDRGRGRSDDGAVMKTSAVLPEDENAGTNRKGSGAKVDKQGNNKSTIRHTNNDATRTEMMERKQQGQDGNKNKGEIESNKQTKAKDVAIGGGGGKKAVANKPTRNDANVSSSAQATTAAATAASPLIPSISPSQPQQTSDINYGRGQSITVLHVAEKPSIAQAVAQGLCSKGQSDYRSKSLPVHEFSCDFPKAPHARHCLHKVTSVAGHVFSVDFPEKYQSWDSVDPAELFHAPIVRKPCKGSVVKHLQDEAKGCDFIVLWLDCDREGENISFEVLDCCMHNMKSSVDNSNFDRVYRAYFSAINPSDIQKAYHSLGKPDKNQSLSVDARQELDLKVGVAFSRFQTRFFQGRYGDLNSAVLSYGPCQTPTLGFCVQRHIDIETFKPEPFWVLELGVMKRGRKLQALWTSGRSFNKNKVERLLEQARATDSTVIVSDVVTKDKKQGRPTPMNTVALLKACSKALGIGPHAAMQAAERLYLSGYLSYPRTESTAYPNSFDIRATLSLQKSDNRWGSFVQALLRDGHNKPRGGVDKGDHPPITPCRAAGAHELSGDLARVYDLVVRHFIASVSPDAVWRSTRVDFSVKSLEDKGHFTLRGKQPVSPGFLAVLLHQEYGDEKDPDDEEDEEERSIPEFNKGEVIPLINAKSDSNSSKIAVVSGYAVQASLDIREKMTTPPSYMTEAELIGTMEAKGIGTDASIPTHIENVQKRNYVTLETGRRLIPSKLGLVLVQGYHQIDSSLVLPQVRSDIEDQCGRIAKGLATKESVVKNALDLFRAKYDLFVQSIDRMDVLFSSSFSKLEDVGKPFSRCGLSRRYLQFIEGPPPRLYNKWTETVYPLPSGGLIKQWTGRHCPVENCNFELCTYAVGQPPRAFPLCPRCFNDPDYALSSENISDDEDDRADAAKEQEIRKVGGKVLTLECPLPDTHPIVDELLVSHDPDGDGAFIVDPHFGPKWRLVGTRNPTIIHLPQSVERVTVLDKRDEVHDVHLMQIKFKEGESPLADGSATYTCCYPADTLLQSMVRVLHGSERLKAGLRGGRGRGRGRGGRGRGRHR